MAGVDFIWDNPPYTNADTKESVLRALVESGAHSAQRTAHALIRIACASADAAHAGKPFCMLLPSSVVYAKLFRDLLDPAKARFRLDKKDQVPMC
jgi:hypothetical protein